MLFDLVNQRLHSFDAVEHKDGATTNRDTTSNDTDRKEALEIPHKRSTGGLRPRLLERLPSGCHEYIIDGNRLFARLSYSDKSVDKVRSRSSG